MSAISDRHGVNLFVSGKSEALTGQRLAKIGYKSSKGSPAKFPSVCVSVPRISPASPEFQELRYCGNFDAIIIAALESAQDGIIRSLYESSGGQLSTVGDSEISLSQCIAFTTAERTGSRLTKEAIETWFDASLEENLTVVIATKLKFDDLNEAQMEVIQKHLAGYRALFGSIAGNKTQLTQPQITGLRRALEVSAISDDMTARITARLDAMEAKPDIEALLDL